MAGVWGGFGEVAFIPEDKKEVNKGEAVQVIMLDWNEEVSI